jgi:hypothetical protein
MADARKFVGSWRSQPEGVLAFRKVSVFCSNVKNQKQVSHCTVISISKTQKGSLGFQPTPREVFFAQDHYPGELAKSDFTHCPNLIYHFELSYSNWETAQSAIRKALKVSATRQGLRRNSITQPSDLGSESTASSNVSP